MSDQPEHQEPAKPRSPGFLAVVLSFSLLFLTWLVIGLALVIIGEMRGCLPPPRQPAPPVSLVPRDVPSWSPGFSRSETPPRTA
jgi:hypothetical protein